MTLLRLIQYFVVIIFLWIWLKIGNFLCESTIPISDYSVGSLFGLFGLAMGIGFWHLVDTWGNRR